MSEISKTSSLVVQGLLDYLKETGQLKLLREVTQILDQKVGKSKKGDKIEVVSTIPMNQLQLKTLKDIVLEVFKENLPIENKINKGILGGFTLRVGDWFLDATLKRELENLKDVLQA